MNQEAHELAGVLGSPFLSVSEGRGSSQILRQYGMIEYCKQGKLVFYSLCETGLQRNTQLLTAHLGRLLSCAGLPYKPSPLRENENYCESMGLKRTFCEEDI